ncbi:MAG: hypothetical protein WAN17_08605 [Candidatus Sulfotelmatobacter sp.]
MDTKRLVIGQDVHIENGLTVYVAKVVKVTQEGGVIVRTIGLIGGHDPLLMIGAGNDGLILLDSNGSGYYITETSDHPGPWQLVDPCEQGDI